MLGRWQLKEILDQYKTQKTCDKAVCIDSWSLGDVPDHFKTPDTCDKAVEDDPFSLQFVPHWFVTQEDIDLWYDYVYSDEGLIMWYDGCQKRKAQEV